VGKGEETRERIVGQAYRLATKDGLDGLTIGTLAAALKMSKSGLFAHFKSKEQLQVSVLEEASRRFQEKVFLPALKASRGLPRLEALFERWLAWANSKDTPGGCIFIAAAAELDDQPGPPRDFLVETDRALHEAITRTARLCVEEGHFRKDVDPAQIAFELHGIFLSYHHAFRLLADVKAKDRAKKAFSNLIESARARN
jgi:AcrR family transcriptional regulator